MIKTKAAEIADNEKVKKSMDYIKEKSKEVSDKVAESEKVQMIKTKATEIAESERVRRSVDYAKDKAAVVATKANEVSEKVAEKTKEGVEYAKEKTRGLREGAGTVWESGRGKIQRVKSNVSSMAWKGSA